MPVSEYVRAASGKPSPLVLSTFSTCCLGDVASSAKVGIASNIYPVANLALYFPFYLVEPRSFTGMIWLNGTVVSGNINGAIYDPTGAPISGSTIGSVAQAGTTTSQQKAFGAPLLLPSGKYYLSFACDNITATFARSSIGAAFLRMAGVRQLAGAFALNASAAAWVGATNGFLPAVGIYEASWL